MEIVFDVTCERLREEGAMEPGSVPRAVGLWMAAETQSEINMRHLEDEAAGCRRAAATATQRAPGRRAVRGDRRAVDQLRPGLSHAQATAAVESLIGARRLEPDPLFMPSAWEHEVELQRQRLAAR